MEVKLKYAVNKTTQSPMSTICPLAPRLGNSLSIWHEASCSAGYMKARLASTILSALVTVGEVSCNKSGGPVPDAVSNKDSCQEAYTSRVTPTTEESVECV